MDHLDVIKREEIEAKEKWGKWCQEIPSISFNEEWSVKIMPPFGGAIARFRVTKDEASVSVYLDCYDRLGLFGEPYWELYPYQYEDYEDVYRLEMDKVDDLKMIIEEALNQQLGGCSYD